MSVPDKGRSVDRHGVHQFDPLEFEHLDEDEAMIARGLAAPIRDEGCECPDVCFCEDDA